MDYANFLNNVLASLIATFIAFIISIKLSKSLKWLFTGILARLVDSDLEFVFKNKKDVEEDLKEQLKKGKFAFVLVGKGSEFQRDTFKPILHDLPNDSNKDIRILFPDINVPSNEFDWTNKNEQDVSGFDETYVNGFLKSQIATNVKYFDTFTNKGQVKIKYYNQPHMGRIVITDKYCYYTPYGTETQSRFSKVYKYRSPGEMYENHKRYFELLWSK